MGLPLDLLVYEAGALRSDQIVCIDDQNPYFQMIRTTWGKKLRQVFEDIEDPQWEDGQTQHPLRATSVRYEPMKKITHPSEKII